MNKKYEESVFYTKDNSCPHCYLDIDENELEEILWHKQYSKFQTVINNIGLIVLTI